VHKARSTYGTVEVIDEDGVRTLYLGSRTVQSSMRVDRPHELVLSYTRSMMAFLLFRPEPARALLLGLGGGSLARFIRHALPGTHVTAVEINPAVIAAAREHFFLPADDAQLNVELGDGADYVAARSACADVIMVDAYDGDEQVDALASDKFYAHCSTALAPDGVLVANVWSNDRRFDAIVGRIEAAFPRGVLCLPAKKPGNVVVLGFDRSPGQPSWIDLRRHARTLEARYGLEFVEFVGALGRMNPHDDKRLKV